MERVGRWMGGMGLGGVLGMVAGLGAWFGVCLSAYVLFVPGHPYRMQAVASGVKVPVLLMGCWLVASVAGWVGASWLGVVVGGWRGMARKSAEGVLVCAMVLAGLGVVIAGESATRNYSVVVLSAYLAFGVGGCAGCAAFYRLVGVGVKRWKRVMLTVVWGAALGVAGGQGGWSLRPLVGWTGQPFEWFRGSGMTMWEQIYYEVQNMRGGGAGFPTSLEPEKKG